MQTMLQWVHRLNLVLAFVILFGAHGLLYIGLDNGNWFLLAVSAALVWTGVLAFAQLVVRARVRSK